MREILRICGILEHNVAVVFDHADFSARNNAHAALVYEAARTYHNINTARIEVLFIYVGLAQARPNYPR